MELNGRSWIAIGRSNGTMCGAVSILCWCFVGVLLVFCWWRVGGVLVAYGGALIAWWTTEEDGK